MFKHGVPEVVNVACPEEGAVEQVGGVDGASAEHGEESAKVGFALAGVVQWGVAGFAFEANLHFFFHAMAFERGNGEAIDEVSFAMAAWFIGVVKGLADGLKLGLVCLADVINGGIAVLDGIGSGTSVGLRHDSRILPACVQSE